MDKDEFIEFQKAYMDREAERLRATNLIDKWRPIEGLFRDVPRGRLLECGSGTGLYSLPFIKLGYEVFGIDLSAESIKSAEEFVRARGDASKYHTFHGDFNEIVPTLEVDFDVIVFIKVLHHYPDKETIAKAIKVAYQKLKPGGCIVGMEPEGSSPYWFLSYKFIDFIRGTNHWFFEKNVKLIRRKFFKATFEALSPESIEFRKRYLIPGSFPGFNRLNLHGLDEFLANLPLLRALAGNLLFKVKKPAKK